MGTTTTIATATAARTLQIDPAHSEVTFQVRHLLTRVRGRFSEFDGTIEYDEGAPERSTVAFSIKSASIDTSEPRRDAHLRSADFFETDTYPTLTFASRRLDRTGVDQFDVHGDLTIHGVTKAIVLPVTLLGAAKDPWGQEKVGFEAEITLNRKDYGLNWNAALETGGFLVGDEVKISLSLQAVAK
jgi:polyisoprenoid-binding protein YceI